MASKCNEDEVGNRNLDKRAAAGFDVSCTCREADYSLQASLQDLNKGFSTLIFEKSELFPRILEAISRDMDFALNLTQSAVVNLLHDNALSLKQVLMHFPAHLIYYDLRFFKDSNFVNNKFH